MQPIPRYSLRRLRLRRAVTSASSDARSQLEDRDQRVRHPHLNGGFQLPEKLYQSPPIHTPELVQRDLTRPVAEPALDPKGILARNGRQRCDQDGVKVPVQLWRAYDYARASLLHLVPARGIKRNKVNVEPLWLARYHGHSLLSSTGASIGASSHSRSSSVSSPPSSAIARRIASSQPARGCSSDFSTTSWSPTTSSTSSPSLACSMTVFGRRTPRELPIRTSLIVFAGPLAALLRRERWRPLPFDRFAGSFAFISTL
ncbi:MAG: hypothetical protein JWN40_4047 [Phycisphaerales bacterium]|nr:hypothetical protein [Phycisphaerales bacterium]